MITLESQPRELKKGKLDGLRAQRIVPGVIYGTGVENKNLQVSSAELEKAYREVGTFQVLTLKHEGKDIDVIIKDVQIEPIMHVITHVDFFAIDAKKTIIVPVPVRYIGESQAVKLGGGSLVKQLDAVTVKCLPKDLIKFIEIDLSKLENLDDHILVRDLDLPETLEVQNAGDDLIVTVKPPRIEKEPTPVETATEATAEGEAGAEGAKPAEGGEEAK